MGDRETTMDAIAEIKFSDPSVIDRLFALRRAGRISWRTFGVGVALANFAADANRTAWPSRATLASIVGIATRHISDAIREMEVAGFIATETRAGQSNVYRLTLDGCGTLDDSGTPAVAVKGVLTPGVKGVLTAAAPITTHKHNNKETTTSHYFETPIPKDKPKPNSFPQGNQTPPPTPAPAAEVGERKARTKPNRHPAWLLWLRVNSDAGQPTPLEEKASLAAARKLAEQIPSPEEQEAVMLAYIGDKADAWAIRQGLTLSVLVNSRLSKCRAAAARVVEEQAADDADLIRQAAETFPDPDERADFFYQRSVHGLRVPPGVDCRPMPAEKEVAV